jgi:hypothetical protein
LDNLKKEFASIEIVGYENSNKDEITQQLFKEF